MKVPGVPTLPNEIVFFENLFGAVSTILLFSRGRPSIHVERIRKLFPSGIHDPAAAKLLVQPLSEELWLCLTPCYAAQKCVPNLLNSAPSRSIKAILRGNAGACRTGEKCVDAIDNVLPFLHLATCFFPEETKGGKMLNLTLKLALGQIKLLEEEDKLSVRVRKECKTLVEVLGYHLTLMRPGIVTAKTVKLINRIAQENEYLQERMLKLLIATMNFWINTSSYLYSLYWDTIKASFACNFKKLSCYLKVESVLQMMDNIGALLPSESESSEESCCARFLYKYYEPMTGFVHFCILSQPLTMQQDVGKLLCIISRRPCHCMFVQILKLLKNLCEADAGYAKAFDSLKGLMTVFKAATSYSMDGKIECLRLFASLTDLSKRHKLTLKQKDIELVKSAFVMFKDIRLYQKPDDDHLSLPVSSPKANTMHNKHMLLCTDEKQRHPVKSPAIRKPRKQRRSTSEKCLKLRGGEASKTVAGAAGGSGSGSGSLQKGVRSLMDAVKKLHASNQSSDRSSDKDEPSQAFLDPKLTASVPEESQPQPSQDEARSFQSPAAVKRVAKLYIDAANVHGAALSFGGVSLEVVQLYNFLLLWALGADLTACAYNSPILRSKVKFKNLALANNPNHIVVNGEPICLLGYIVKKMGSAKLSERLIKDMQTLCLNRPENIKALLVQTYFVRQLIKLEHRLHYNLSVIQDGSTEELAKRTTGLVTGLLCEGLRWTSSIAFLLKLVAFAAQIAEAGKTAPLIVFSTSVSSQNLWLSILLDYSSCLSAYKPMNSQLAVWQNVPMMVVNSVRMLSILGQEAKNEEQRLWLEVVGPKDGGLVRIAAALFEIVQYFWAVPELVFISAASEDESAMRKHVLETIAKGKSSALMHHLKLLTLEVKDEGCVRKSGRKQTLVSALAQLFSIRLAKFPQVLPELEFWTEKASATVRYLFLTAEFARAVGESAICKEITGNLSVLFSVVVKATVTSSKDPVPEAFSLLQRLMNSTLRFMANIVVALPHSNTLEFYKKHFLVEGTRKLLIPVENLGGGAGGEVLKTLFQGNSLMQKQSGSFASADEETLAECKKYALSKCSDKAEDKKKRELEYKLVCCSIHRYINIGHYPKTWRGRRKSTVGHCSAKPSPSP